MKRRSIANCACNNPQTKQKLGLANVVTKQLLWGDRGQLEALLQAEGVPDVIIGADVICWPNFIAPLLWTLRVMLTSKRGARCFVGYVCRATTTTVRPQGCCDFGGVSWNW
jgi:hypothetical protein